MSAVLWKSRRVVADGTVAPRGVVVREGKIAAVVAYDAPPPGDARVVDVGDDVISPGIVDSHAHLNEPGRTEWEGFVTATHAAAAGGITTVVDMPLNCIPVTTSRAALAEKRAAVRAKALVDHAFWGGVVPGNARELEGMIADGVVGFKAFLCHSGIDDFPASEEAHLRAAMPILASGKVPLLVHAEIESAVPDLDQGDPRAYATYLASRPQRFETSAIALLIALLREFRGPAHVVHLSAADALPLADLARREGLPLSLETCPHYLTLAAEEIADGRTDFKCAPPIRERENQERLWTALREGLIDQVVSDHSPCTPALKKPETGDFLGAWGGIASLQLALPLLHTAATARGCTLVDLARWMSEAPAKLAGVSDRKGRIAKGHDADLVVWSPEETFVVDPLKLQHRHPITPYAGKSLRGVVKTTILRGAVVFDGLSFPTENAPGGRALTRG